MTRQQERNYIMKCVRTRTVPTALPKETFRWKLVVDLFGKRLVDGDPLEQVIALVDNRALFGEVLITLYDLNIDGFACVESARGELFIAAQNEVYYD